MLAVFVSCALSACATQPVPAPAAERDTAACECSADAPKSPPAIANFLTHYSARNPDGSINVVVEIPAGTTAKLEVTADGSGIEQDQVDGRPRYVEYLGYPANYGMVPRTVEDPAAGGDGDPLDVVLLGPPLASGTVISARLIGVMRMVDSGERDDKLLAVLSQGAFASVTDAAQLDEQFPGVLAILRTWFSSYKGAGRMTVEDVADAAAARGVLALAEAAYAARDREAQGNDPAS